MSTHQPVLLTEAITGLAIKAEGVYIDGTFGRGGHSQAILKHLNKNGRLIAIDKDHEAIRYAQEHFANDSRFSIVQGSFAKLEEVAKQFGVYGQVDGILLDLGVSSPQLDNPERGFSFIQKGPLDMRMDNKQKMSAANYINHASAEELATVFREYGEERFAGRIARAITQARENKEINDTAELAEIVKQANPKWEKHKHPATRVFQALRIYINQELTDLNQCLDQCLNVLAIGGRLAVISFHSLEDRIVKQFMHAQSHEAELPREIPIRVSDAPLRFKRIGKAIKPTLSEVGTNVRARSAILRIGEKLA